MRKTILASDMDGTPIEDGKGAIVTIKFNDGRKGFFAADLTDAQADEIKAKANARSAARRGRKPKVAAEA